MRRLRDAFDVTMRSVVKVCLLVLFLVGGYVGLTTQLISQDDAYARTHDRVVPKQPPPPAITVPPTVIKPDVTKLILNVNLTIDSIDPPQVWEGQNFTINYTVTNNTREPANGEVSGSFQGVKLQPVGDVKVHDLKPGQSARGQLQTKRMYGLSAGTSKLTLRYADKINCVPAPPPRPPICVAGVEAEASLDVSVKSRAALTTYLWFDALTGKPATSLPAPYDLATRTFDDNGIALNPRLGSQVWSPAKLASPSICGGGDPWTPPCTTQPTWIDNNKAKCPVGKLGGHANWGLATYEGRIYWENHSHYLQDDDYSFALYRDDLAGMTEVDVRNKEYLHSEFNSDETINYFHTWYWDALHQAVDADAGKGGILSGTSKPPYTRTRALFDGKEAIVMGLFGLDCAHECGSELHPVYAIAIHVNDSLDDDTWAIFVRNWGDEGYCSSGLEMIDANNPFTFSFRLKRPGASAVSIIPAADSDPAGHHGTVFYGDHGTPGTGWSFPMLVPGEGAVVTFTLPPASQRERINGMLHLKWSVSSGTQPSPRSLQTTSPLTGYTGPDRSKGAKEPEAVLGQHIAKMTPQQRKAFLATIGQRSVQTVPQKPVKLLPQASPAQPAGAQGPAPRVVRVPDTRRDQRDARLLQGLRAVYGEGVPFLQTPPR